MDAICSSQIRRANTIGVLTLGYQFGYVNILPVYVALPAAWHRY